MFRKLRFLSAIALAAGSLAAQSLSVKWYPTNTNQSEGVYVYIRGLANSTQASVRIEGESQGKPLPAASGVPDKYGFVSAPIVDARTYRIVKLVVSYEGKTWVLDNPKRGMELELENVSTISLRVLPAPAR